MLSDRGTRVPWLNRKAQKWCRKENDSSFGGKASDHVRLTAVSKAVRIAAMQVEIGEFIDPEKLNCVTFLVNASTLLATAG